MQGKPVGYLNEGHLTMAMKVGTRVVRGPDWKWSDQDDGKGHLGTVVTIGKGILKNVVVCWDMGKVANYRAGFNERYDLLIYDNAAAGVRHNGVTCDECKENDIAGMRWKCSSCYNYDLCNKCYMTSKHDLNHFFLQIIIPKATGKLMPPRVSCLKIEAKGLFPGAEVCRGRDWQWLQQDGMRHNNIYCDECKELNIAGIRWKCSSCYDYDLCNTCYMTSKHDLTHTFFRLIFPSSRGELMPPRVSCQKTEAKESSQRSDIEVRWNSEGAHEFRLGHDGKVNIKCLKAKSGYAYYNNHLPKLGEFNAFELGDRVVVKLDKDVLQLLQENHGLWVSGTEKCIGKVGRLASFRANSDVIIEYPDGEKGIFNPAAVTKLPPFNTGDKVRLMSDEAVVKELQKEHGGWENMMSKVLGEEGHVLHIDAYGNAMVNMGGASWTFNPKALISDESFCGVYIIKDPKNEVKLTEIIGKGGFGEVWKGQWRGNPVAVKLLTTDGSQDSEVEKEVAIHKRALHPNIVKIMAVGHQRTPANAMIVMQLIDGSNLSTVIFKDGNPYEFMLKVRLSRDLLSAVTFLHHCKILHLDIKPQNVIVESRTKKPYLCDLGLAHIKTRSTMSRASFVPAKGTFMYMPPECCTAEDDNMPATSASDVWALACTFLEFFSGQSVWPRTINQMALLRKFMGADVMPASVEKLEQSIKKIVKPCFQKEPSKRPSAESMMQQFSGLR